MSTFVGRHQELDELAETFDHVEAGEGTTVFVTGGAGAGKTSLVEQFLLDVSVGTPETQIAVGTASEQYGSGEPYQPFVEAFEELIGTDEEPDGASSRKEQLKQIAGKVAPYWISAIPVAGNIVAAAWETARELTEAGGSSTANEAPPNEETLFYQYTEILFAAAEEAPVVLFLDDLHWADEATCSLLGHVARRIDDKPVLILGTYRPADVAAEGHPVKKTRQELERYGAAKRLEVEPLSSEALVELVEAELDAPPSPELIHFLKRRAGTNPLFFSEFLQWTIDQDFCRRSGGEWILTERPEEIDVPRSAESTIEKRLDRLDEDVQHILEYASVQGDEFDSTVLSRLLDMDELELEERLQALVRGHRLIRPVGERDFPSGDFATVYRFRHSLIQDVLHGNLFGKRRVLLHRKVASILEELYGDDTGPVDYALALHYDHGRQPNQAFEAAVRAADRAAALYAHADALELLERARRNVPGREQEIDVLERVAEQHRILGRFPQALEELEEAIEAAEDVDASDRILSLRRQAIQVELDYGQRPASALHEELDALADAAREADERAELCQILWCYRRLPTESRGGTLEALREAREIARELNRSRLLAQAEFTLGAALAQGANPERGLEHLTEALDAYEELEDRMYVGHCHNGRAVAHCLLGDYESAREEFAAALDAFDEVGDPVESLSVLNNLGVVLTRTGEWEDAEEALLEALRLGERLEATPRLLNPHENLARLYRESGRDDEAREHWERLLDIAKKTGYWRQVALAHCGLGLDQLNAGRTDEARRALERARTAARSDEDWWEGRRELELLRARLALDAGHAEEALRVARDAQKHLETRDRYLWAVFRLLEAEVLGRLDGRNPGPLLEESVATFRDLGTEPKRREAESLQERLSHHNGRDGDHDR